MSTYLFVDGGHLRRYHAEIIQKWTGNDVEPEIDFEYLRRIPLPSDKMFYYDSLDNTQQSGEDLDDYKARVAKQEGYFNRIREVPASHVKLGSMTGTDKNRRQKEVDIRLAVDMLNHAWRKNCSRAVLLSGDRDFRPVVESLVDIGLNVTVLGDRKHTSQDLARAADHYIPITFESYFNWSAPSIKAEYPLPDRLGNSLSPSVLSPNWSVKEKGKLNGEPCQLHVCGVDNAIYIPNHQPTNYSLTISHSDRERLELFCTLEYGELIWHEHEREYV